MLLFSGWSSLHRMAVGERASAKRQISTSETTPSGFLLPCGITSILCTRVVANFSLAHHHSVCHIHTRALFQGSSYVSQPWPRHNDLCKRSIEADRDDWRSRVAELPVGLSAVTNLSCHMAVEPCQATKKTTLRSLKSSSGLLTLSLSLIFQLALSLMTKNTAVKR